MNPKYDATYIFPNDYPAVRLDQPEYKEDEQDKQNTLKVDYYKLRV